MTYYGKVTGTQQEQPAVWLLGGKGTHHQHCKVRQVVAEAGCLCLSPDGLTPLIAPAPQAAH